MPACAPVSSPVSPNPPPRHPPARTNASACGIRRQSATISPTASSATASLSTSGVLVTRTPRARQAAMSIAS